MGSGVSLSGCLSVPFLFEISKVIMGNRGLVWGLVFLILFSEFSFGGKGVRGKVPELL